MKFFLLFFILFLSFHATLTLAKPIRLYRQDILLTHKPTISNLVPSPLAFLAKVSIGEPPVPKLLYVDTGSSFTWIKRQSQLPLYDPKTSSTYKIVGWSDSSYESTPPLMVKTRSGECIYIQYYLDGSESQGILAKETFQFDGLHLVSDVEFGYGANVINGFEGGSGLLGLAFGNFSILKHFSNKFSLCFGTIYNDPYYGQGFLALGDEARTTGKTTPLIKRYNHYHVELEAIFVNGRVIPNHLAPIKGNTIIDTGTSILYLAGESYRELEGHIGRLVNGNLYSFSYDGLVCYNGTIQREMSLLPTVTLVFDKGASLELNPTTLFHQYDDEYFCLAVMMTPKNIRFNFIGTTALQNYNIGFDLDNETIYFDKIPCMI